MMVFGESPLERKSEPFSLALGQSPNAVVWILWSKKDGEKGRKKAEEQKTEQRGASFTS